MLFKREGSTNVLRNMPPESNDSSDAQQQALSLYEEAWALFEQYGLPERAELMAAALIELRDEIGLPAS